MNKTRKLKKAAAEAAAAAAAAAAVKQEVGRHALDEGLARASEILAEAQKRALVAVDEAQRRAVPAAKDASARAADFASKHLDAWEPQIRDALDRVSPAVEAAKVKVADDFLPRIQHVLHDAAAHPVLAEATSRGEAAVRALKGEVEPPRKSSKLKTFGKVLAIGAIVAGAVAAVRHFLTPKDDGWTAHEPSKAYVNNNDTFATAARLRDESATASTAADAPTDAAPTEDETLVTEVTPDDSPDVEASTQESTGEETEVADAGATVAAAEVANYGEGAYVGENPPEGYVIKGNERSKKYHLAGSGGYERTIAEVWFNSEEAAQAAGFTKAQR